MAQQKMVWFSDAGQLARSQIDAEQMDAWAALINFIEKWYGDSDQANEAKVIESFLDNHAKELLPFLKAYVETTDAMMAEVMKD